MTMWVLEGRASANALDRSTPGGGRNGQGLAVWLHEEGEAMCGQGTVTRGCTGLLPWGCYWELGSQRSE